MKAYVAVWPGGTFVRFRALRWDEHRRFSNKLATHVPMGVYNDIYRLVVLEGPEIGEVTAGIAEYIGNAVLNWSAFSNDYAVVKAKLDAARSELASDYLLAAKATVCHVFHYSMSEIDKWDSDTLFKHIAMVEMVTRRPGSLEPIDPNTVKSPTRQSPKEQAPKIKKKPNEVQQMVIDRMRKSRGA